MANRVTETEVRVIITTSLTDLSPFITVANQMIDAKLLSYGYTDAELKEIERWLSAHFVSVVDPKLIEEEIGDSKDKHALPKMIPGLQGTVYGQQVLVLDRSGILNSTIGKKRAYLVTE